MTCRGTYIMFELLEQKHHDLHFNLKVLLIVPSCCFESLLTIHCFLSMANLVY